MVEGWYDFFVVGDWVVFFEYDEGKVFIYGIFFWYFIIERKVVGKFM